MLLGACRTTHKGVCPSMVINSQGVVVEVLESGRDCALWHHAGEINGPTVERGQSIEYGSSRSPSAALPDHDLVIASQEAINASTLHCRAGEINGKTIQ